MALNSRGPSKHNQTLIQFFRRSNTEHSASAKAPPAKRCRIDNRSSKPPLLKDRVIPDSEAEDEDTIEEALIAHQTDLESALPPIQTNADAIEEYEAFKASQNEEGKETEERLRDRKWERGKSSIYVDAFNLALDTVLEDEYHLFGEAETDVFRQWRELNYEAQYL